MPRHKSEDCIINDSGKGGRYNINNIRKGLMHWKEMKSIQYFIEYFYIKKIIISKKRKWFTCG